MKKQKSKKYFATALVLLGTISMLGGCGNSDYSKEEMKEIDAAFSADERKELQTELNDNSYNLKKDEAKPMSEYKLCEKSTDWSNYTLADGAVQIEDVIYSVGCTVPDFIEKISASSIDWEYEYNPDQIVSGRDAGKVEINRDGTNWFLFRAYNFDHSNTANISDLVVTSIEINKDVLQYCRYLDGRSYEDMIGISYNDIKSLPEFADANYSESNADSYISCSYDCTSTKSIGNNKYEIIIRYRFNVDKQSSMTTDFSWIDSVSCSIDNHYYTDVSDLTDEDKENITQNLIEAFEEVWKEEIKDVEILDIKTANSIPTPKS